jgi:uncharacterized membrane protein (DUF373 family)
MVRWFELIIVSAVQVLLAAGVAVATVMLYVLFIESIRARVTAVNSVGALQENVGRLFSGVLVVLLGLELIETLKTYFVEHHVRTELILTVALIAIGLHVIQLELERVSGGQLAGLAALITAVAGGYFLIRRSHSGVDRQEPSAR